MLRVSHTVRKWFEVRETLQNDRSFKNWIYQKKYQLGITGIISISYLKGENCCDKLNLSCLWLDASSVLEFCSVAAVNGTTVWKPKVENYAASLRKRTFSNCPGWVTISPITHKMIGCIPFVYEVTSVLFRLKCRIKAFLMVLVTWPPIKLSLPLEVQYKNIRNYDDGLSTCVEFSHLTNCWKCKDVHHNYISSWVNTL